MKKSSLFLSVLLISLLLTNTNSFAQSPTQSIIDVGKITSWVRNDGFHDWVVNDQWYNGSYPNGIPVGVVFSEGINWSGLVHDLDSQLVRTNGNNYISGTHTVTRLYRVRTDYATADLTLDAANFFMKDTSEVTPQDIQTLRDQYQTDWNSWPADFGAPYFDVNGDGSYDASVDIPGVPGALQTIWIAYDDDWPSIYESDQIGLYFNETYWAYASPDSISSVIYKKVDVIYDGTWGTGPDAYIDSMYICQWTDTDIGNYSDDFSGCDTLLNLGYSYNSDDDDPLYSQYQLKPPAAGSAFLQGVAKRTGNSADSAIFNFRWMKGYKYVQQRPLNIAAIHRTGGSWSDPLYDYYGARMFYNLMGGYRPEPPYPVQQTGFDWQGFGTYMLSGDPVTGTGDIDGVTDGPGDRRFWLMNGPFRMDLHDTVEVVLALVAGMGEDNLSSVTALKQNTQSAINFFNDYVESITNGTFVSVEEPHPMLTPDKYMLYQNYPNPFNPVTTIRYELPEPAHVTLTVYDALGREAATLVNQQETAGQHSVQYDAGSLASGVYLYRITFENGSGGTQTKTMKFILLK